MKRPSDADDTSSNKRQEVEYDATFEKITSCKVSLGKVISSNEWRNKLRKSVSLMTQMRVHGTRAFSDYILYAVIDRGVEIRNEDQLTTIVRSCYIANTNDDNNVGRPSSFFHEPINQEWLASYRQDFNEATLDKEGMTNIITFDVKSYVSDIKNYLMYGIRDHFIRFLKNVFPKHNAKYKFVAALRFLKKIQTQNPKKEYSFKLSDKDIFIAQQERNDETNDAIQRILKDEMLKNYPAIDNTYSSAFKFLHWVNQ